MNRNPLISLEAATRFELVNSGFADRCLTTWLCRPKKMERETGFEPATSTLARSHSTTELFPLNSLIFINRFYDFVNRKFVRVHGVSFFVNRYENFTPLESSCNE
jgi:hypothetical protein